VIIQKGDVVEVWTPLSIRGVLTIESGGELRLNGSSVAVSCGMIVDPGGKITYKRIAEASFHEEFTGTLRQRSEGP
jgi:hypothetical protein